MSSPQVNVDPTQGAVAQARPAARRDALLAAWLWFAVVGVSAFASAHIRGPHALHYGRDGFVAQIAFKPEALYIGTDFRTPSLWSFGYVRHDRVHEWPYLMRVQGQPWPSGWGIDALSWGAKGQPLRFILRLAWPLILAVLWVPAPVIAYHLFRTRTPQVPLHPQLGLPSSMRSSQTRQEGQALEYWSPGQRAPEQLSTTELLWIRILWGCNGLAAIPLAVDLLNGWRADVPAWASLVQVVLANAAGLIAVTFGVRGTILGVRALAHHGWVGGLLALALLWLA